jgi:hypothetical protein
MMQTTGKVDIVTEGAGEPSGLAMMLAQYFEQNLRDFPRKSGQALRISGKLSIEAVEGDVAVTVCFRGGEIAIREGSDAGADMFVRGGIFSITELATGSPGAIGKIFGGKIRIRSAWKHPVFALRVAGFMKLPSQIGETGKIGEDKAASPAPSLGWKLAIAAGTAILLGLAAYVLVRQAG